MKKNGLYTFKDEKGGRYRIAAVEDHEIVILHQISGNWYRLEQETPFKGEDWSDTHPCTTGIFARDVRLWSRVEGAPELLILSQKNGQLLCKVNEQGILHPSEENLRLSSDYDSKIFARFGGVVSKDSLLIWKNKENEVIKVEMPTWGITFNYVEGKWRSDQHTGFFLDPHFVCPALRCINYLLLCNDEGRRIALVSSGIIKPQKQNMFEFSAILSSLGDSLFTYALDKQGNFILSDLGEEEGLYLFYLALCTFDYSLARQIFQQMKKARPEWKEKDYRWISQLDVENEKDLDTHPEAIALRLQIRLLWEELTGITPPKLEEAMKRDYMGYLALHNQTYGAHLTPHEELTYLNNRSIERKFQCKVRKHKLNNSSLPEQKRDSYPLPSLKDPCRNLRNSTYWVTAKVFETMMTCLEKPQPIAFLANPGPALIDNFLYFYRIARQSNKKHPQHQQLRTLLQASRVPKFFKSALCHKLLTYTLLNPEDFPSLEDITKTPLSLKRLFNRGEKLLMISGKDWEFKSKKAESIRVMKHTDRSFDPTPGILHKPVAIPESNFRSFPKSGTLKSRGYFVEQDSKDYEASLSSQEKRLEEIHSFFKECEKEGEPCEQREFTRLIAGVEEKQREKKLISDVVNLEKILEIGEMLIQMDKDESLSLKELKKKILWEAQDYRGNTHLRLEKGGRMLTPLTLKELIVHFGTENDQAIYNSNPSFNPERMESLKALIHEYLITKGDNQQTQKLLDKLTEIKNLRIEKGDLSQEVKDASADFVQIASAQRVYDSAKEPHLLVFEFFSKIRLRLNQYQALTLMSGTEENIELEARTGFGKSKVLNLLWLFLKSRKDKVAMMTLPASLFKATLHHLRKILGRAFDLSVVPIQFNRNLASNHEYLERLSAQLEEAKKNHQSPIILISLDVPVAQQDRAQDS